MRRGEVRAPAPWRIRDAFAALVGAFALGLGEFLALHVALPRGPLLAGLSGILLDLTLLATIAVMHRRRPFGRAALGLRRAPPAASVGWVVAGFVVITVFNAVYLRALLHLSQRQTLGTRLHGSTIGLVLAGVFACAAAPVTEEVFFRGVLYRALRGRMTILPAAVIAAVVFGLVHGLAYPLETLPPRAVFGLVACLLYERTGSLLPGIALHAFVDASGYETLLTGHSSIVFLAFVGLGLASLGLAAVGVIRRSPPPERDPAAGWRMPTPPDG